MTKARIVTTKQTRRKRHLQYKCELTHGSFLEKIADHRSAGNAGDQGHDHQRNEDGLGNEAGLKRQATQEYFHRSPGIEAKPDSHRMMPMHPAQTSPQACAHHFTHTGDDQDNRHNISIKILNKINLQAYGNKKKRCEEIGNLSLIHISEPTRRTPISYAVFCL